MPAADPPLPYRGEFGLERPARLAALAMPPRPMPSHQGLRPLKAWRYVGVYGPELLISLGAVRIGPARQAFWAVWDRGRGVLEERTTLGRGSVRLERGRARVSDGPVSIDLVLEEMAGIECVCPSARGYAWTRKQGGVRALGNVTVGGVRHELDARAIIDDTAGYYARHTSWRWSAGVGHTADGRELAWNRVSGVNDPPRGSERTLWVAGVPREIGPARFAADLSGAGALRFSAEAVRESHENLLLLRSSYRQPFGCFSGELPGGIELAEGYGVMEEHDVWW
ncbi:MAG: DUF2804 family protein [Solirubrobacteraceae bacterium]